ncbi:TetR/AcrR family transcriptional regulator [Sphingopyxis sp. XHP0097]|jgi:AcrR family transcriptional regulator|uniref:TetR/AcrR family transcriptional regulator n=1 Tax=Sphingopyxis jiangsuensis TaxID=2871171 RepID=A0ABS7MBG2_9SPHN|nr:TetR/AcrR family transcriptional regulator [Sphingopyxis jiangsuensis]MBY4636353.1 TetR/AcrR family transcriptional regulator [Sphingopyxis jiangsuensis]
MSNEPSKCQESRRPYRLGKRAKSREETRKRIVEAAIDLHGSIGPARTTVAQIAERAGVQRHTYYAHFPTEWDLFLACSGTSLARDPLPDPEALRGVPAGGERVLAGLTRLYEWFARNEQLAGCVLRDAEHHELTQQITALRMTPSFEAAAAIMSETLGPRAGSLLAVALAFPTWRTLGQMLGCAEAAELMRDAILGVDGDEAEPAARSRIT